jgi:hypothetical protein
LPEMFFASVPSTVSGFYQCCIVRAGFGIWIINCRRDLEIVPSCFSK